MKLTQPVFKNKILNNLLGFILYVIVVPVVLSFIPLILGYSESPNSDILPIWVCGLILSLCMYCLGMTPDNGVRGNHILASYLSCVIASTFVIYQAYNQTGSNITCTQKKTVITYQNNKVIDIKDMYKYTYINIFGIEEEYSWTEVGNGVILLYTK